MQNYGRHQMTASDADSNSEVTSLSVRVTLLTIFIFGALALLLIPVSNFPGPQMPGFIPCSLPEFSLPNCPRLSSSYSGSADNAGGLYCCWAAPISTQL